MPRPMSTAECESSFILRALGEGLRVDGRRPRESRPLSVACGYLVEPTRNARKGTELLRVCTLIVTAVIPRARHLSSRPSLLLEKKVIQESDGKPKQLSAVGRSRGEFSGVTDFLKEE